MADTKNGREDQAQNAEKRQRQREIAEALERGDETEPPVEDRELDDVEKALDSVAFPATGAEIVDAAGDQEVATPDRTYTIAEVLPESDEEEFEDPDAVRMRVQRPTVAAGMKRIVEAKDALPGAELSESQREAYERTLRELRAIDAVDDDEGITAITDWIVERIREKEKLPGSRDVRRQAAKYCRRNGYEVRNDEWLGV